MAGNYANAKDVLPPELLAEVQRFHTGHLWVPPNESDEDRERQRERDRLILALRAEGLTGREIAERMKLSERRVWQILFDHSAATVD